MKTFHVRGVTNDFTTFSPTFTKMLPSRVHVSRIFRSRFSLGSDGSARAKASVVTGALESRDEIAASRASISIVVCGSSGVAGGIGLSEYALPARVRIIGRWQMPSQALLPSFTNNPAPRHARSALHQFTNSHDLDFVEF